MSPVSPTEGYTQAFIKEFGIPAVGHDYSTAKSAGLKVKTSTGDYVKVTAVVDGKEYLFADLYLPAGTHALPVTLPASVTGVIINTASGAYSAGVDETVDLDARRDAPQSRINWTINADDRCLPEYDGEINYWASLIYGVSNDQLENRGPLLAFKPSEFLEDYFKANPVSPTPGTRTENRINNTDYWYQQGADGSILFKDGISQHTFWGETAIASGGKAHNNNLSYYVFPIYWRKRSNTLGKQYHLYMFSAWENPDLKAQLSGVGAAQTANLFELRFEDRNAGDGYSPASKPFPQMGASSSVDDISDIDLDNPMEGFSFDDGVFTQAYDLTTDNLVLTRGIKITFIDPVFDSGNTYLESKNYSVRRWGREEPKNMIGFALRVGANGTLATSIPMWNRKLWSVPSRKRFYDETIDNLMFANVATKRTMMPGTTFHISMPDADRTNTTDNFYPHKEFEALQRDDAFLLGFNLLPGNNEVTGDTKDCRDYADVVLLVVPETVADFGYFHDVNAEPYTWTIAAEDLGSTDDWDFNDAVFSFTDVITNLNSANKNHLAATLDGPIDAVGVRTISVKPLAAGGTLPIYITYNGAMYPSIDIPSEGTRMYSEVNKELSERIASLKSTEGTYVLGCELHKWLGSSSLSPVNVGSKRVDMNAREIKFFIPTDAVLSEETGTSQGSVENKALYGFAIIVDKDDVLGIDAFGEENDCVMVDHKLGNDIYVIGRPDANGGNAPQMILVGGDWEWPAERKNIGHAYPNFKEWVTTKSPYNWYNVGLREHLTGK